MLRCKIVVGSVAHSVVLGDSDAQRGSVVSRAHIRTGHPALFPFGESNMSYLELSFDNCCESPLT